MNSNPIIIIDDDEDDSEVITQAFKELGVENEILVFKDANSFLDYIRTTTKKTFLILCDINMSQINGLELKNIIYQDERLRLKCIPFLFLSTSGASASITKAYSYGVQGYFIKPNSFGALKELLQSVISYWGRSQCPSI